MKMSPARAAKHIKRLEAGLGATLVNRTPRQLSLTEAGADFLDRAERILAELREAEALTSCRTVAIEGLLRVSAPATFGVLHLSAVVADFHRQHLAVTVELGLTDRYVDLVEERWGVAIRFGVLADSSLIARELAKVNLSICASPDYLAKFGIPQSMTVLAHHDCLGFTLVSRTGTAFWALNADGSRQVPVRGSLHADNGEALIRAAMAGQGLVYGPRYITADGIAAWTLINVVLDEPLMDLGAIYAITHPTRRPAAKTRTRIDFLARRLPAMAVDW